MKKVLIAGDDPDMDTALVSLLGEKYQVCMAGSREEVLDCLRRKETNLLIVDVKTPVVKTLHLIQEAKNIRPDLAVIVMYIYFDQIQDVEHLLRKVADVCIRKPFDNYEVILKAIQQLETKKRKH
jgi:DNA-binding NtrC family response regulator